MADETAKETAGDTKIGVPGDDGDTKHREVGEKEMYDKADREAAEERAATGENRPETDNRKD